MELSFPIRGFIKRPRWSVWKPNRSYSYRPAMENFTAGCARKKGSYYWPSSCGGFSEDQAGCKKAVRKYKTEIWCHEIERPWHKTGLSNWVAKLVLIPIPSRRRRRKSKKFKRGWRWTGPRHWHQCTMGENREDTCWYMWECSRSYEKDSEGVAVWGDIQEGWRKTKGQADIEWRLNETRETWNN